jgi:hypothetical protein
MSVLSSLADHVEIFAVEHFSAEMLANLPDRLLGGWPIGSSWYSTSFLGFAAAASLPAFDFDPRDRKAAFAFDGPLPPDLTLPYGRRPAKPPLPRRSQVSTWFLFSSASQRFRGKIHFLFGWTHRQVQTRDIR